MRRPARAPLTAVLLLVGLALGACGDDDPPPPGPPTDGGGDDFAVGDRLGGPEAPTTPLMGGTLQTGEGGTLVMTCGALACVWQDDGSDGGTASTDGVGGAALAATQDIALVAVGGQVLVIDMPSGEVTAVFEGHAGAGSTDTLPAVRWVALSPDGEVAASAGNDGRTFLWSTTDGEEVADFGLPEDASPSVPVFSPDGGSLALTYTTGSNTVEPIVVDTGDREVVAEPEGLDRALAWTPDGSALVGSDGGGEIRTWDAEDDFAQSEAPGISSAGPAVVSPDSGTLAALDRDQRTIRVWDLATDRVRSLSTDHRDPVVDLAFADDGRLIASATHREVQVRRVRGAGLVLRLDPPRG